jgi:hypothetical protein
MPNSHFLSFLLDLDTHWVVSLCGGLQTPSRHTSLFACLAFGRGFFSFDVLSVSKENHDFWFATMATVRTA